MSYSESGYLIVFQEINLFSLSCKQVSFSVTKGIYYSGSDYDYYKDIMPDPAIPGKFFMRHQQKLGNIQSLSDVKMENFLLKKNLISIFSQKLNVDTY